MTSPTPPPAPPPDGPQKKPAPPKTEPKEEASSKKNSFDAMLGKAGLNETQRKAFFNSLMQQAAATIKGAFRHMIDTMKKNQRGE